MIFICSIDFQDRRISFSISTSISKSELHSTMNTNTNTNTTKEASACELQCQSQQDALTACMNAIRDAREMAFHQNKKDGSGDGGDSSFDISKVDTSCLASSVASWTECCAKANNESVEVNQGHIGIY